MKSEEEKTTQSADIQTRRVISTQPKRTASSSILPDAVQSTNSKKRRKDNENLEDASTVIANVEEQGNDEEVNMTNNQLLSVVPLKELQQICIVQLNSTDWDTVHAAMEKLYEFCKDDRTSIDASKDICKNHLIPCITCAMCHFVDNSDMIKKGLGLLGRICFKVSDSVTAESAVTIMNVIVLAMQKHPGKAGIQRTACLVLYIIFVLMGHLSTIRLISKNMRVLNLIVDAMKNHQNDKIVQEWGCSALTQYYDYMNDRKAMEAKICLEVITKAMSYECCRKEAAKLMRLISTQIES